MRRRWILPILFCLCVVFVVWNMAGELWILRTWRSVLLHSVHWLAIPALVLVAGLRAKTPSWFRSSAVYLGLSLCLFAWFALNGSSDNGTADMDYISGQLRDLARFPVLQLLLALFVFGTLSAAHRVDGMVRRVTKARA